MGGGAPGQRRELRVQGRKTMRRLADAGLQVFAQRGYHESRVDDIVRVAETSHGTFYLYFSNKEDLLRTLAIDCASEVEGLAAELGPIDSGSAGEMELRDFLARFVAMYRRYGVVIRAWMEDQVSDRDIDRLGVRAFTKIATALGGRMEEAGLDPSQTQASAAALMAMIERSSYAIASRDLGVDDEAMVDSLAVLVHRGFFGASATRSRATGSRQ